MSAQDQIDFSGKSYKHRLWLGWGTLLIALVVVLFHAPFGLFLMFAGVCVIMATYYAKLQNEADEARDALASYWVGRGRRRLALKDGGPADEGRKMQALEYRDLFSEGVISFEEYHNAVAGLYPELKRRYLEGRKAEPPGP